MNVMFLIGRLHDAIVGPTAVGTTIAVCRLLVRPVQWWIEGWATGAAAQGTKGGGTKEGRAK